MSEKPEKTMSKPSLIQRFGERYHVDADKVMATLKATAFRLPEGEVSDAQMMVLLIVAEQHKLNPFTKEIYAFPDKNKGVVPVVGVDGWSRIINEHPDYKGVEFVYSDTMVESKSGEHPPCHEWVEARLYRKNLEHPFVAREYFDEAYRAPIRKNGQNGPYTINTPWQTHPKRFLRHKALIQAARGGLGFSGIYDQDEGERIIEGEVIRSAPTTVVGGVEGAQAALAARLPPPKKPEIELPPPKVVQPEAVAAQRAEAPAPGNVFDAEPTGEDPRIGTLRAQKSPKGLKALWKTMMADAIESETEIPVEVEAFYHDRLEQLSTGV